LNDNTLGYTIMAATILIMAGYFVWSFAPWLGAEPVIPVRRDSRVKDALRVGRDFVSRGAKRLVELFRKRWSIERLFGRAKE